MRNVRQTARFSCDVCCTTRDVVVTCWKVRVSRLSLLGGRCPSVGACLLHQSGEVRSTTTVTAVDLTIHRLHHHKDQQCLPKAEAKAPRSRRPSQQTFTPSPHQTSRLYTRSTPATIAARPQHPPPPSQSSMQTSSRPPTSPPHPSQPQSKTSLSTRPATRLPQAKRPTLLSRPSPSSTTTPTRAATHT